MFKIGDMTSPDFPCEIVSEISGGSMAKLFIARLKNTEHLFMVKAAECQRLVFHHAGKDRTIIQAKALKKEARMLTQLYHPYIPEIFGFREEEKLYYCIMSYHSGTSLPEYIREKGQLGEERIQKLALSLCEVLAYIHEKGIIHGDIKPSNLIYPGEDGRCTLLDFGTAEYKNKKPAEDYIRFQGTLGYAPPECWHRDQYIPRETTDIFAVGALLFYLLEGKEPREHFGRFVLSEPQKKNRWQPVLDKCCALNSENRYQSTAEIFKAVKRIGC